MAGIRPDTRDVRFAVYSRFDGYIAMIEMPHIESEEDQLLWIGTPKDSPVTAFDDMYEAWNRSNSIYIEAYKRGGYLAVRDLRGF